MARAFRASPGRSTGRRSSRSKQATAILGTGYQYGDTDFIEYSERIYTEFRKQLRYGNGAVALGNALVNSKLQYLEQTPGLGDLHVKALLESALYGLPMLGVNLPSDPCARSDGDIAAVGRRR